MNRPDLLHTCQTRVRRTSLAAVARVRTAATARLRLAVALQDRTVVMSATARDPTAAEATAMVVVTAPVAEATAVAVHRDHPRGRVGPINACQP